MSNTLIFNLTPAGRAILDSGNPLTLTQIAFGSAYATDPANVTALGQTWDKVAIAAGFVLADLSLQQIRIAAFVPGNATYNLSEIGLWSGDPYQPGSGQLLAYTSHPQAATGGCWNKQATQGGWFFRCYIDFSALSASQFQWISVQSNIWQSPTLTTIDAHEADDNPHWQYLTRQETDQRYTQAATSAPLPLGVNAKIGISSQAARADHVHALPGLVSSNINGLMSSADKNKLDALGNLSQSAALPLITAHKGETDPHPQYLTSVRADTLYAKVSSALPSALGSDASAGTSSQAARADHVHALPTLASSSSDGLMSAVDKTRLEQLPLTLATVLQALCDTNRLILINDYL